MSSCDFVNVLNKLRKSSCDSIDDVNSFDDFKVFMHVVRDAECDLKDILRNVNSQNKKTLVLLCGSAGDGKSHLLSYLKNSDDEQLLDGYTVYNDATESAAPNKTAIDTLYGVLSDFKDENIDKPGKNIILAINLGVLSNFIESEYGSQFGMLKSYVNESYILSSQVNSVGYKPDSSFQHISFSDYHMYLLSDCGPIPQYIELLFEKIICQETSNPFYSSYKRDCMNCPLCSKCPVKANFEFFCLEEVRSYIAALLVNVVIREKEILTTRELLNYVYDFLVSQDFDFSKMQKCSVSPSEYLCEYMKCITPSIMFERDDITTLMNKTHKYDPLLYRDEAADNLAIEYYVADDVTKVVEKLNANSPYDNALFSSAALSVINSNRVLKSRLFNILIRIVSISTGKIEDETYQDYVRDLYNFNAGRKNKLSNLYSDVEEAVTCWCGNESDGNVCIDDQHRFFSLYENIEFEEYLDNIPNPTDEERLVRFLPYIVVEFQDESHQTIKLDIDFSLYELVKKLKRGYVQTAEDRNNHADFISFVAKILKTGSANKYVTIVSADGQKSVLEKTKFGVYKFKVVK